MPILIRAFDNDTIHLMDHLLTDAHAEGHEFVERTLREWKAGINCFSLVGEVLFGVFEDGKCIGTGGLNIDPYTDRKGVGRVRHVYISPSHRREGIAAKLLELIVEQARREFECLRLFTPNSDAAAFYESLGFARSDQDRQSHILIFSPED